MKIEIDGLDLKLVRDGNIVRFSHYKYEYGSEAESRVESATVSGYFVVGGIEAERKIVNGDNDPITTDTLEKLKKYVLEKYDDWPWVW